MSPPDMDSPAPCERVFFAFFFLSFGAVSGLLASWPLGLLAHKAPLHFSIPTRPLCFVRSVRALRPREPLAYTRRIRVQLPAGPALLVARVA